MAPIAASARPAGDHRRPGDRGREPPRGPAGRRSRQPLRQPEDLVARSATRCGRAGARPYTEIVARMRLAMRDAAGRPRGHEAVIVSHQLPIWMARCDVEGRRLAHDPRKRECALASITSFTYLDGRVSLGQLLRAGRGPVASAPGQEVRRRCLASRLIDWDGRWRSSRSLACCSPAARVPAPTSRPAAPDSRATSAAPSVGDHDRRRPTASRRRWSSGRGLGGDQHDHARPTTPARSSCSTSGAPGARPAGPRRRSCRRPAEETAARAQFVGLNTQDYDPAPAVAFVRAFEHHLPEHLRPDRHGAGAAVAATCRPTPSRPPWSSTSRAGSPPGSLGTVTKITLVDLINDVAAGR